MQEPNLTTRYADMSSRPALAVAGVCLLAMCVCLTASFVGERRAGILQQGGRDLQAYRNIITRVHAGEDPGPVDRDLVPAGDGRRRDDRAGIFQ